MKTNIISSHNVNGIKIGQTTAAKLGFFGTTPVVRPAATASVRAALEAYGLLAEGTDGAADGAAGLQVARGTFDPTANTAQRTIAAHVVGPVIPINAIIVGGFVQVNTALASGGSATVAVSINAADDIIAAAAFGGAPWSTTGRKAITPKANTPESTSIVLTAARQITFTTATAALTGGKATAFLYFVIGA
jgi:hypothetical protein